MESTQHGGGDTNVAPIRTGNLRELNYERNKELRTEKTLHDINSEDF